MEDGRALLHLPLRGVCAVPVLLGVPGVLQSIYDIFDPSVDSKETHSENYVHVLKNTNFVKWFETAS